MPTRERHGRNQIDRLRIARGFNVDQFCRLANVDKSVLGAEAEPEQFDSATLDRIATTLGVPLFTLLQTGEVYLDPLPEDYRTEGNRAVLHTRASLKAVYRTYEEADFLLGLSRTLRQNRRLVPDTRFNHESDTPEAVAKALADFIDLDGKQLASVKDPHQAFNLLRYKIESAGCYVFTERVKDNAFRGFCFERNHNFFLFVNGLGQSPRARIFTAVHELAHLFFNAEGIVSTFSRRLEIERACNAVTARYLLPTSFVRKLVGERDESESPAATVSRVFSKVPYSRFFIAIRLQELGSDYRGFVSRWLSEVGVRRPSATTHEDVEEFETELNQLDVENDDSDQIRRQGSGAYHSSRLGFTAVSLMKIAREHNVCSVFDLESSLNVPAKVFDKLVASHARRLGEVRRNAPE